MKTIIIKNKKPVKSGNSFYFTIPKAYINYEIIDTNKVYNLKVEEVIEK